MCQRLWELTHISKAQLLRLAGPFAGRTGGDGDYPTFDKEMAVIGSRVNGIESRLAEQVCGFMQLMRTREFYKRPGVAESIDWALALMALGVSELEPETVDATLGCVLKYKEDIEKVQEGRNPVHLSALDLTPPHSLLVACARHISL